jgi:hypothetical protein
MFDIFFQHYTYLKKYISKARPADTAGRDPRRKDSVFASNDVREILGDVGHTIAMKLGDGRHA